MVGWECASFGDHGQLAILKVSRECLLKDGLPQAGGALEVGGDHGFQFLHHAQPPLDVVAIR